MEHPLFVAGVTLSPLLCKLGYLSGKAIRQKNLIRTEVLMATELFVAVATVGAVAAEQISPHTGLGLVSMVSSVLSGFDMTNDNILTERFPLWPTYAAGILMVGAWAIMASKKS